MDVKTRIEIFERFEALNPDPCTELLYQSDFELLVAVMLSAQATDASVNKATRKLFPIANTPEAILALGEETLKTYIKTINYFHTKARHLMETAQILHEQYASQVPNERGALEGLPGVGRKTANVILNVLFAEPTIAVDTHIFRVANRTGIAPGKSPLAVEKSLEKNVPGRFLHRAHHWLVLHGRYICIAKKPLCGSCPIEDLCEFPEKTI